MKIARIAKLAIIVALYVALTYAFAFMSYGNIQFRIAEILVLLVFFRKDYAVPLVIACMIANILSPLGIIDLGFGTAGTLLAVLGIMLVSRFKKAFGHDTVALAFASIMPVITNGLLVGWELNLVYDLPYWPTVVSVALGEFVVVSILGVVVFTLLAKNRSVMNLILSDDFHISPEE